jgi:hypothetical protein
LTNIDTDGVLIPIPALGLGIGAKPSRETIMEREILLLLPLLAGVEDDSGPLRALFERWWQGAE